MLMTVNSDTELIFRRGGDVRHEAEARVDTQSFSFTNVGAADESLLTCGVVSGSVKALPLQKSDQRSRDTE